MNLNRESTELVELPLGSIGSDFSECLVEVLYMHNIHDMFRNEPYKVYVPAMVSRNQDGYYTVTFLTSFETKNELSFFNKAYIYDKRNIPALFTMEGLSAIDYIKVRDGYLVTYDDEKRTFDILKDSEFYMKWKDAFCDWNEFGKEDKS